ncbi:MAG: hypothetical protein IIA59_04780 [Candidatus Marinimicrobia bacterium]|nr:hypothetical protein [Candidatus Neomarinimicrobiota bacterium]
MLVIDGLDDVGRRAGPQSPVVGRLVGVGGQKYNRQMPPRAHLIGDLYAVQITFQGDVQQYDVR